MLYEFIFISMSSFSICLDKEDIFRYFPQFKGNSPFFANFPHFCKGEKDFLTKKITINVYIRLATFDR